MSLQINKDLTKATCIEDLSHLKGLVKSDVYEEEFPIIGKTYKLDSMFIINEWRDSNGRCIPRRPLHSIKDIIKVHLFGWKTQEDMFEDQEGFKHKSFIYDTDPDKVYEYLKMKGLNIRTPGLEERLAQIYKEGSWKEDAWKKKMEPAKLRAHEEFMKLKIDTSAYDRFWKLLYKQETSPGGFYHNLPYYGLRVVNERVIEHERAQVSVEL